MAVDAETRKEIKRQAKLYEIEKEKVKRRIQDNVRIAKEKLEATERELLEELEVDWFVFYSVDVFEAEFG